MNRHTDNFTNIISFPLALKNGIWFRLAYLQVETEEPVKQDQVPKRCSSKSKSSTDTLWPSTCVTVKLKTKLNGEHCDLNPCEWKTHLIKVMMTVIWLWVSRNTKRNDSEIYSRYSWTSESLCSHSKEFWKEAKTYSIISEFWNDSSRDYICNC